MGWNPPMQRGDAWQYPGWRYLRKAALLACALAIAGCGGAEVNLEGEFPHPLIAPLPASVGLVLDDELTKFVHDEKIEGFGAWHLDIGAMQPKLFRSVIGAMFATVKELPNREAAQGLQGVLVPSIADFQIAIPSQTRTDFYEVWIKYVIRLYDATGTLVVEWPLTAYGKANQGDYGLLSDSDRPGMTDATMTALRDAAAFMALRFPEVPEVQRWHAAQSAGGADS